MDTTATSNEYAARWLREYGDDLYRYACRKISNHEHVADVLQNTFLSAIQAYQKTEITSNEKAWLMGILKHKIADHYRSKYRKQEESLGDDNLLDVFNKNGLWQSKPKRWGGMENSLDKEEFIGVLDDCISKLPEKYRHVFLLREYEEVSAEEICQMLQISTTNLWKIMSRARHSLRICLETNWFKK